MKHRKLRIAFSAVCGIVCLLLIVLWVRSYWWFDMAVDKHYSLMSLEGCILCGLRNEPDRQNLFLFAQNINEMHEAGSIVRSGATLGFMFQREPTSLQIGLPHWLLAVAAAALGASPWLPWRFSVRTLLIGMTLVAALLGAVAWAVK